MAEAKQPKKSTKTAAKPIADVAHPGKTPPSPTSRAIITNHATLKDPMVVTNISPESDNTATAMAQPAKTRAVGGELKLQPLSNSPAASVASDVPVKADEPPDVPATPVEIPDEKTESKPEAEPKTESKAAAKAMPSTEPPTDQDTPDTTEPAGSINGDSSDKPDPAQLEAAEAAKQAEHVAEIQKLVDSKKYFLPINAVERRRSKRFIALGVVLSLILALAWLNIALDAGLIEIPGVKPFTHFFST